MPLPSLVDFVRHCREAGAIRVELELDPSEAQWHWMQMQHLPYWDRVDCARIAIAMRGYDDTVLNFAERAVGCLLRMRSCGGIAGEGPLPYRRVEIRAHDAAVAAVRGVPGSADEAERLGVAPRMVAALRAVERRDNIDTFCDWLFSLGERDWYGRDRDFIKLPFAVFPD
jgi:hypothetical protein